MIPFSVAIGVLVFFVGIILVASIIVNICTQRLISKCISILDFAFFLNVKADMREGKRKGIEYAEPIRKEGTE